MKVKNVILLSSWLDMFEHLTDEQLGEMMRAILQWRKGDKVEIKDQLIMGMFMGMHGNLEDMVKKYQNKVDANRKNGAKGGRPKTQETQMVLEKPTETQPNPKNLKDKDKEKEKDKEREKDTDKDTVLGPKEERIQQILNDKETADATFREFQEKRK